jgi:hypothetical protein
VQNREVIRDVAGNVYERIEPALSRAGGRAKEFVMDPVGYSESIGVDFDPFRPIVGRPPGTIAIGSRKKKTSKFNRAVKAGMTAVKKSTSYGKKGTINNARKAFSAVTKVASKVNRGAKVSAKGVTGTIARAVRKIL